VSLETTPLAFKSATSSFHFAFSYLPNHFHFHSPLEELSSAIREKRFTPDSSDNILRWCALNMMTTSNAQGKMMPDKRNSSEKIDAIVALLMALRLAMLAPSRPTGSLFIV